MYIYIYILFPDMCSLIYNMYIYTHIYYMYTIVYVYNCILYIYNNTYIY